MSLNKKFIGISQRLIENDGYYEIREALSLDWGKLFKNENLFNNFLPLPISYEIDFKYYANSLSGVILSGGNDLNCINPNKLSKIRDNYEISVIDYCIDSKIPILGICRGAQILAHYFKLDIKKCDNHLKTHTITKDNYEISVNSFHNYCIINNNQSIIAIHKANDNTIESFKHINLPIFGVMWHIERENADMSILKEWINIVNKD